MKTKEIYRCKGSKYNQNLSAKEIRVLMRNELKSFFPEFIFSVNGGARTIELSVMQAPYYLSEDKKTYRGVNPHHLKSEGLTAEGLRVFSKVKAILDAYNYCYSDAQQDRFYTNFYMSLKIGRWNKPFQAKQTGGKP